MEKKTLDTWERVLRLLKMNVKITEYNTWILNIKPLKIENNFFIVEVDNDYLKNTIEKKFKEQIVEILNVILMSENIELKIKINEKKVEDLNQDFENFADEKKDKKDKIVQKSLNLFEDSEIYYNLNERYVFENFVVGKSNEFAHAAAVAVAENPGKVSDTKKGYNPLFIYGGVGLGKTHLMHAVGNKILKKDPKKRVLYCTSEQFTNDLINSISSDKKKMMEFREKYRKLDLLMIDDIQFIAGKESTQEEFFHTFNELHQAGKQIILSSDRPPKEFDKLEKRLVSRFEWGLTVDIQTPDYETRVAILKKKAELENTNVSETVLKYIAETVNSNIRELEGSLNRIVARASLLKREINTALVEEVFSDETKEKSKVVTKEKIIEIVSDYYEIPIEDMKSKKRQKDIAKARQVSMYLLREILQLPFMSIGDLFGGKDHTTVMHSVGKVEKEMKKNKYYEKDILTIKEKITG